MISDETFDAEGDLARKSEAPEVAGQPNDEQKREVAAGSPRGWACRYPKENQR